MKPAKEVRVGNIIMVDGKPFIVLRSDVNGSSRIGFTLQVENENLLTNSPLENVFRGDDKFDVVVLDKSQSLTLTCRSFVCLHGRRIQPIRNRRKLGRCICTT